MEEIVFSNVRRKRMIASLIVASAISFFTPGLLTAQQSAPPAGAASNTSLDYEFFKARVEPIFLKNRSADHVRCYQCHQVSRHPAGLHLELLPPGKSFWNEEQSRRNFETVSKLVVPGTPLSSLFVLMPLAPEAGGLADTHQGGRQFASQDDPDWKNIEAWVRGQKAAASSAP
jgi:hypothetical protein